MKAWLLQYAQSYKALMESELGDRYERAFDSSFRIAALVSMDVIAGIIFLLTCYYYALVEFVGPVSPESGPLYWASAMVACVLVTGLILWQFARGVAVWLFWRSARIVLFSAFLSWGSFIVGFWLLFNVTWGAIDQIIALDIYMLLWLSFVSVSFVPLVHTLVFYHERHELVEVSQ